MPSNAVSDRPLHRSLGLCRSLFLAALACLAFAASADAQLSTGGYDPNSAWPLCGNLFTTSPDALNCPSARHGDPNHRDDTNDTFGPRLIGSRYDWHRGIDLDTDGGTNRIVYAATCGVVIDVDLSNGRPNYAVVLRHHRNESCSSGPPSATADCGINGCYYTRYKHLQNVFVNVGDTVDRGEALGGSGANCEFDPAVTDPNLPRTCDKVGSSKVCTCTPIAGATYSGTCPVPTLPGGICPTSFNPVRYQCSAADSSQADCYEHVHFEVRDSYGQNSPGRGHSQRKAIHPLTALPYDNDDGADDVDLTITSSVTTTPSVTVRVELENSDFTGSPSPTSTSDMDLQRVEIEVYENMTSYLQLIDQASASPSLTADLEPYQVSPPYIDFVGRSRQYTYENTTNNCGNTTDIDAPTCLDYDDFRSGGTFASPFSGHRCFPTSYDADYHVESPVYDPTELADPMVDCEDVTILETDVGQFNGIRLAPANFNFSSQDYILTVNFDDLDNPSNLANRCVKVFAVDARDEESPKIQAGNCSTVSIPPRPSSVDVDRLLCYGHNVVDWPTTSGATEYEVWTANSNNFWLASRHSTTSNTYQVLNVSRTTYVWVKACNAAGCSSARAGNQPATFTFGCL